MDLSLFTNQIVNVRLKNQNFYKGVKLTYTRNANYVLGPALDGSYYSAYSSEGTALYTSDTGLDIEDIQLTNLNLNDYVGHDVEITLRSWDKHQCELLEDKCRTYPFISNKTSTAWTKEGEWFSGKNNKDIIHIKFSKPRPPIMNRPELLSTIAKTKKQLTLLEEQLAQSPPTLQDAVVGDVLADGSEVIQKWDNGALLAAPAKLNHNPSFGGYLSDLSITLNRWDWFIPTAELLDLAFGDLELNNPNRVPHWTSSGQVWHPFQSPNEVARIRAFRYVTY
jgi:hypothetical protein